MVMLRDMRQDEYLAYCEYFVYDYSHEIVRNYGYPIEKAVELAKGDLARSFPETLQQSEHFLLCIETQVRGRTSVIGYLWHLPNVADKSTFIFDFYIAAEYRGSGYGKQAMTILEERLKAAGIAHIKLRVAYHNQRAVKLYEAIGFSTTGFNMAKVL